ncbi:hypothetical protein [Sulfurisphaera ohwakuensis]|uniref:hypothetical protein n=1 Tax=Sulfurisphaera ohwakuensis TaxID=69656 RepID=UPI0036F1E158
MSWNFKSGKISLNSKKTCTVDEVIDELKNKYNLDISTLSEIVNDVLIKHFTEHKMQLEDIKKKYANVNNIDEILQNIVKIYKEKQE